MPTDIVQSLFGPTPYELQQKQQQQQSADAYRFAQLDPMQRAAMGLYQGGAGLAGATAGMFGYENPAIAEAKRREAAMAGIDLSSPNTILQRAAETQDPRMKMQLGMLAREMQAEKSKQELEAAKTQHEIASAAEIPKMRHEEMLARISQAAESAKQRSEDVRRGQDYQNENKKEALRLNQLMIDLRTQQMNPAAKPLPPKALQMQGDALEAMNLASNISTNISSLSKQIDTGELNLGMIANLKNKIRNKVGLSTVESQNLASLDATLQKLRNDSLRLNKGTQTEGDAVRAWDELVNNINDPKVVKQRLDEITRLNNNAVDFQKKQVDMIRMNYGHDPMDFSGYTEQPASVGADKEKTWTAKNPNEIRALYKAGRMTKAIATAALKDMEAQGLF